MEVGRKREDRGNPGSSRVFIIIRNLFIISEPPEFKCSRGGGGSAQTRPPLAAMHHADNFSSLSVLHLNAPSHILPASCSPDKDLLLVISRLGIKDTVSLWKMQGAKKWEVDVSVGNAPHEDVTGIAWSPDGK